MQITFINNAGCIYESDGFKLLVDPWITDGAFEGSWFTYPPREKEINIMDANAIYISHLHQDHYDVATLSQFPKTIPILIFDHENKYLLNLLKADGFEDIREISFRYAIGPLALQIFGPFVGHPHEHSDVGNIIDSSILIKDSEHSVFNQIDNALTPETLPRELLAEQITLFQVNSNAAGPYPSAFNQYTVHGKKAAAKALFSRSFLNTLNLINLVKPKFVSPIAGEFVIGGSNWEHTKSLGATTSYDQFQLFQEHSSVPPVYMWPGRTIDLADLQSFMNPVPPEFRYTHNHMVSYAETLAAHKYPYENDPMPTIAELKEHIPASMHRFLVKSLELSEPFDLNCCITFDRGPHCSPLNLSFNMNNPNKYGYYDEPLAPYLRLKIDARLGLRCLKRKAHWNDADVGLHISYERYPDKHTPDLHTLLSFLHE